MDGMDVIRVLFYGLALWVEMIARIAQRDAFAFKKSKKELRKGRKQRTLMKRLLGIYSAKETNAPCHMLKYTVIRMCNVVLTVLSLMLFAFISSEHHARLLHFACLGLQQLFLMFPLIFDAMLLSNAKNAERYLTSHSQSAHDGAHGRRQILYMIKSEFIIEVAALLKARGYRKRGNYWYKSHNDLLLCVNVQGSQWDKDDYYVNIGAALALEDRKYPSELRWIIRYRCETKSGEDRNISPEDMLEGMEYIFSDLTTADQIPQYLSKRKVVKVANLYDIL